MPTGYTADIAKGISFKEYALGCARAFGALIMMRDEPVNAEIPDKFEPDNYHKNALEEVTKELTRLQSLSEEEKQKELGIYHQEQLKSHLKYVQEKRELKKKYLDMLAEAKAYETPSLDHAEYKNFMIQQIEESIKWDCLGDEDELPKTISTTEWYDAHIDKALWDIKYHTKKYEEEIERSRGRTVWVSQLKKSLEKYND